MSTHAAVAPPTLTSLHIRNAKGHNPLVMITAYDHPSALLADAAGVDILLVGDSLGMAVLGHNDTLCVTVEHIIHHCRAVAAARPRALLVADMPFLSYEEGPHHALRNAGRLVVEGGARAVKLEGRYPAQVRILVDAGIPVMGHVGLTPQRVATMGGYKIPGRTAQGAEILCKDALALQEAGCFALVLECVPCEVATQITRALDIPTIGIGAGPDCDGQVLVWHDLLGITPRPPKFVKQYANLGATITTAITAYVEQVRNKEFPHDTTHSTYLSDEERKNFKEWIATRATPARNDNPEALP